MGVRRCGGELAFPWRGGGLRRPHFFLRRKKCGKESRLDLRSKDPLARGGFRRPGGEQVLRLRAGDGEFRAPARVTFFCCQKKVTKEKHSNLRFKDPLARYGSCRFGGVYSRMKCGGYRCRFGGSLVPLAPLPLTLCEGRIGCAGRVAIIKSRPLRREAPQWVGVPVGHGYNYFLACDTAERIIFTIVTGSGSGKLCWHSRGTDSG